PKAVPTLKPYVPGRSPGAAPAEVHRGGGATPAGKQPAPLVAMSGGQPHGGQGKGRTPAPRPAGGSVAGLDAPRPSDGGTRQPAAVVQKPVFKTGLQLVPSFPGKLRTLKSPTGPTDENNTDGGSGGFPPGVDAPERNNDFLQLFRPVPPEEPVTE